MITYLIEQVFQGFQNLLEEVTLNKSCLKHFYKDELEDGNLQEVFLLTDKLGMRQMRERQQKVRRQK